MFPVTFQTRAKSDIHNTYILQPGQSLHVECKFNVNDYFKCALSQNDSELTGIMLLLITCVLNMLKMQGLIQNIAFVLLIDMLMLTQFQIFHPSGTFSQSWSHMQHSSLTTRVT